jgi:hypothetical protein
MTVKMSLRHFRSPVIFSCDSIFAVRLSHKIKNRPPKAWQSHAMGSGGHQTDSKPASVLADEASIEVENRRNCLTHDGVEGHCRIGFRRPNQVGRIQAFVLSQENK